MTAAWTNVSTSTVWTWVKLGRFQQRGHRLTGDRTRRSRQAGWEDVHSIVDDCRRLAYSEIHDETATTVAAFTRRALDFYLSHGVALRAADDRQRLRLHHPHHSLRELLHLRAIRHIRARPYTPRTNGKEERYQQTLQREWAYALESASSDARRQSLPHWVRHYNERRTHSALGNRPPLHRVREVTGLNS